VLLYIVVVLTFLLGMWLIYIYIYRLIYISTCLVSSIFDVIHAECGNILILLYSRVEFYFCWFESDHFLYKFFELLCS